MLGSKGTAGKRPPSGAAGPQERHAVSGRDAARTKAALLNAAVTEFAERGYAGARVHDIVARAGLSQRAAYYHYADKAALYAAVVERAHAVMHSAGDLSTPPEGNPLDAVAGIVRTTWDHCVGNPEVVSIVHSDDALLAPVIEATPPRRPASPSAERLGALLRIGADLGSIRGDVDPLLLHITIEALCIHYLAHGRSLTATYGRELGTPAALARWRDHVVNLVLASLRLR